MARRAWSGQLASDEVELFRVRKRRSDADWSGFGQVLVRFGRCLLPFGQRFRGGSVASGSLKTEEGIVPPLASVGTIQLPFFIDTLLPVFQRFHGFLGGAQELFRARKRWSNQELA